MQEYQICEAKKKRLDERGHQLPAKGRNCHHKSRNSIVSHDPGNDHEFFINISHCVMDQQKRHWQRIDDIADQQSVKSIDIKQLSAK